MHDTFRFGRVAGIPVGAHWSVLVVAALVTFSLGTTILPSLAEASGLAYLVFALAGAGAFLASILAHELGHALTARREGVSTQGITLWLLGGVARLESEPATPGASLRIAAAGPAVSFAIALGAIAVAFGLDGLGSPALLTYAIGWLGVVNAFLALFNLLPAAPLDGGRILQAWLWHRSGDDLGSMITAAKAGRYLGGAMLVGGLYQLSVGVGNGLWTMSLALFILSAASSERRNAERRRRHRNGRPNGLFEIVHEVLDFAATTTNPRPEPARVVVTTGRPVNRRVS